MVRFSPHFPSSGRKSTARGIEIGEREEREHLCAVFGDAAIADLAIAELAFDDAKHVFDLRAHFAEAAVASALPRPTAPQPPSRPGIRPVSSASSLPQSRATQSSAGPSAAPQINDASVP